VTGVLRAVDHEQEDRREQRDDEPADAPDQAFAELGLAPAREEAEVETRNTIVATPRMSQGTGPVRTARSCQTK
jgi:hypothetical protein